MCSCGDQAVEQRGASSDQWAWQTSQFHREDHDVVHVAGRGSWSAADAACGDGDGCGPGQLRWAESDVSVERRSGTVPIPKSARDEAASRELWELRPLLAAKLPQGTEP